MSDKPWEFEQPLCAEVGVEAFYVQDRDEPEPGVGVVPDYNSAKKICKSCIHQIECAEWGIKHETHGMWGGLTPQERKIIRGSRKITIHTPTFQI